MKNKRYCFVAVIVLCLLMSLEVFAETFGKAAMTIGEADGVSIINMNWEYDKGALSCDAKGSINVYDGGVRSNVDMIGLFKNGMSCVSRTESLNLGKEAYVLLLETDGTKTYTYTGKRIKPSIKVSLINMQNGKRTDLPKKCYVLRYDTNKAGVSGAIINLKSSAVKKYGVSSGTARLNFFITPKPVTSVTVKSGQKNTAVVKFTTTGVAKSQFSSDKLVNVIEYSTDRNFKTGVKYKTTKSNSLKISGLKSGKTYYFRVASGMTAKGAYTFSGNINTSASGNSGLFNDGSSVGIKLNFEDTINNYKYGAYLRINEAGKAASGYNGKLITAFSNTASVKVK